MSDDAIKTALDVAKKRICICDGECYETRHGRMHGPCEGQPHVAAIAIAAYHEAMAQHYDALIAFGAPNNACVHRNLAAAIRRAGGAA